MTTPCKDTAFFRLKQAVQLAPPRAAWSRLPQTPNFALLVSCFVVFLLSSSTESLESGACSYRLPLISLCPLSTSGPCLGCDPPRQTWRRAGPMHLVAVPWAKPAFLCLAESGTGEHPLAGPVSPRPLQLPPLMHPLTVRAWIADAAPKPIGIEPTSCSLLLRALGNSTRQVSNEAPPSAWLCCCGRG